MNRNRRDTEAARARRATWAERAFYTLALAALLYQWWPA